MKSILENGKQLTHTKPETHIDKNPLNLAASWYVAMLSKELGKKPKAIKLFGLDLVAWRDQNGTPVIMERYCSHMGASLAIGEVKDGCIQCPFHHWRYDNLGDCVSIPDIEHIPPTARQATYVTTERYGWIWVWYGTSSPLFPLPEVPSAEDEKHNYMLYQYSFKTKTTAQRLVENNLDSCHLSVIHKLPATKLQVTLLDEQHSPPEFQSLVEKEAWFGGLIDTTIDRYFGPVGVIRQFFGYKKLNWRVQENYWPSGLVANVFINGKPFQTIFVGTTPISESETMRHTWLIMNKTGSFLMDIIKYLSSSERNKRAAKEDLAIWETMNTDIGGAYIKHDEELLKFRKFYQRWVDKVEI